MTGSVARARGICPSRTGLVPILGHGSRLGTEELGLLAKAERASRAVDTHRHCAAGDTLSALGRAGPRQRTVVGAVRELSKKPQGIANQQPRSKSNAPYGAIWRRRWGFAADGDRTWRNDLHRSSPSTLSGRFGSEFAAASDPSVTASLQSTAQVRRPEPPSTSSNRSEGLPSDTHAWCLAGA